MSISLLLEKYDVSTDEGLQKALAEIEKEESEVDEALSSALSRACTIEGRLRTASQGYHKLSEVKSDAQNAADMVEKTAALARDVSAKVRQLDLARGCVFGQLDGTAEAKPIHVSATAEENVDLLLINVKTFQESITVAVYVAMFERSKEKYAEQMSQYIKKEQ